MLLNVGAKGDEEESQLKIGGEDLVDEPLPSELEVKDNQEAQVPQSSRS